MIEQFLISPTGGGGGGAGTGFTTATTAGTNVVGTLNAGGLSMGVPAYLTTAALSQDSSKYAGTGFTTATTAGTNVVGTLATNGISMGIPAYLTTAMASNAATISNINISAGTTSTNASAFTFSNSNNVSFGINGQTITGSIATTYAGTGFTTTSTAGSNIVGTLATNGLSMGVPNYLTTALTNINISAGTTSTNGTAFTFSNANNVSFGLGSGASVNNITASIATTYAGTGFTTATTSGTNIVGTLNTSGLSMGVPAYLTTAAQSEMVHSYFANIAAIPFATLASIFAESNSFYVAPISIQHPVSMSYMRLLAFGNFNSTTIATSAVNNATGASTAFSETQAINAVVYTVGTGANSRSLQEVFSTSVGFTWAVSVSQASTSNASRQTISQAITYPSEGASTLSTATTYFVSATNGPISTTQWIFFFGILYLDIPFATSLAAGNYWLALNRMSGTVGGKNIDYILQTRGVSQTNQSIILMNQNTALSNCGFQFGLGNWTTNVAQTTSSIGFASITMTSSYFLPYVQFINQA